MLSYSLGERNILNPAHDVFLGGFYRFSSLTTFFTGSFEE